MTDYSSESYRTMLFRRLDHCALGLEIVHVSEEQRRLCKNRKTEDLPC